MKQFFRRHWRAIPPLIVLCALWGTWGCDHTTTPPPSTPPTKHGPLTVSLLPTTDTLSLGTTLSLSATISGWATDSTVSWTIIGIGVAPGTTQAQLGSIACSGRSAVYTAPSSLTASSLLVRVRVRANEDTLSYTDCSVTILNTASHKPTILVNPTALTLKPDQMQQFQATVYGSTNTGVRWELVSGPGTLSANGLYLAPTVVPDSSETAIIEALLLADTTIVTQATIKILYPGPCFQTMIQPFFISNCTITGCHNPIDHIHSLDFTSYDGLMTTVVPGDTAKSQLFQRITHIKRPSNEQIAAVAQWILAGAPNSECNQGLADCDTVGIHYSTFVQPMIATYCLGCHTERFNAVNDSVDFSTYNTAQLMAQTGYLLGVIRHKYPLPSMPEYGPKLDSCTIAKIADWVNRGAPND